MDRKFKFKICDEFITCSGKDFKFKTYSGKELLGLKLQRKNCKFSSCKGKKIKN